MPIKEKLEVLKKLRDEGIITQDELNKKIDSLLDELYNQLEKYNDVDNLIKQVNLYKNEINQGTDDYDSERVVQSIINYKDTNKGSDSSKDVKLINIGFYLGITSIFLGREVGMIPLLAIILILIGKSRYLDYSEKLKRRANIGLILGIIYFILNLSYYGHI